MPGNEIDPFEIKGNLSVIAASDALEFGDGSIDVDSNINMDGSLGENTLGNGFNIKDLKYLTFKQQVSPSNPTSSEHNFYIDTTDSLLKSKDSSGVVTNYQPTNTKGDLLTHNGTTQIKLPVGNDNYILIADSASSSGLKWIPPSSTTPGTTSSITIIGTLKYTEIQDILVGTFYNKVYNLVAKGPSSNFFYSKSIQGNSAYITRLNTCKGITSLENLKSKWINNEEPEISKTNTNYDGNYSNVLYPQSYSNSLSITGSTFGTFVADIVGNFIFSIKNDIGGSHGIFFITKNIATKNASIIRLVNSPGTSNNRLRLRWLPSSTIEIRKTNNNDDGTYQYHDILTESPEIFNVTLSGTTETTLNITKYQRVSGLLSVKPLVSNGPSAIFSFSKNDKTVYFNQSRIVNCPGDTTLERLKLNWLANNQLKLYKTGSGYDGSYEVTIIS